MGGTRPVACHSGMAEMRWCRMRQGYRVQPFLRGATGSWLAPMTGARSGASPGCRTCNNIDAVRQPGIKHALVDSWLDPSNSGRPWSFHRYEVDMSMQYGRSSRRQLSTRLRWQVSSTDGESSLLRNENLVIVCKSLRKSRVSAPRTPSLRNAQFETTSIRRRRPFCNGVSPFVSVVTPRRRSYPFVHRRCAPYLRRSALVTSHTKW